MRLSVSQLLSGSLLVLLGAGCASLPSIERATCGNGIVEQGEDCDTFGVGDAACSKREDPHPCRLTCSRTASDNKPCPDEWTCGNDGLCRQPSGAFSLVGDAIEAESAKLLLGDFNGDGRKDIVSARTPNALGQTSPRVHYLSENLTLESTEIIGSAAISATSSDLDNDGLDDLIFNTVQIMTQPQTGGAAVLLGQSNNTFTPVAYPTFELPNGTAGRISPVTGFADPNYPVGSTVALTLRIQIPGTTVYANLVAPPAAINSSMVFGLLMANPDELTAAPLAANLDRTTPCDELLFAKKGDTKVGMMRLCDDKGIAKTVDATKIPILEYPNYYPKNVVKIPAPSQGDQDVIAGGVLVIDLNDDGFEDILVGGKSKTYVAFGQGDGSFVGLDQSTDPAEAIPLMMIDTLVDAPGMDVTLDSITNCSDTHLTNVPFPLAVGDNPIVVQDPNTGAMTKVHFSAFVQPNEIDVRTEAVKNLTQCAAVSFSPVGFRLGTPWSAALIGDATGDGFPDVIATTGSEQDLDLYTGTGKILYNPKSLPTDGPVTMLALADVDGDLVNDIVMVMKTLDSDSDETVSTLAVAFGAVGDSPSSPQLCGNFGEIAQIAAGQVNGVDLAAEIGVVTSNPTTNAFAVAVLNGSGDRVPLAPFGITASALDNTDVFTSVPIAVAPAHIRDEAHHDLIMFAYDQSTLSSQSPPVTRFWGVTVGDDVAMTALVGSGAAPVNIQPIPPSNSLFSDTGSLVARLRAADLDNDGVDEFVFLSTYISGLEDLGKTPSEQEPGTEEPKFERFPALLFGRVSADKKSLETVADDQIVFSDVKGRLLSGSDLQLFDIDGDGFADLTVLVEVDNGSNRLEIFWNDGKGKFSLDRMTELTFDSAPQGIATLVMPPVYQRALVVTTEQASYLVTTESKDSRTPIIKEISGVSGGVAVATGDVTGDGIADLVVAQKRLFRVYAGEPKLQ